MLDRVTRLVGELEGGVVDEVSDIDGALVDEVV